MLDKEKPSQQLSETFKTPRKERRRSLRSEVAGMGFSEAKKFLSPEGDQAGRRAYKKGNLPFQKEIQRSFGRHDVSEIHARTGGGHERPEKFGATAFTSRGEVVFGSTPDLFTSAHEAAHALEQRVKRPREVRRGRPPEKAEVLADRIAERVVSGEDAEPVIDEMLTAGPAQAIQFRRKKTVSAKASKRLSLAQDAILHTKNVIAFGAGNQYEALKRSNFNTYFRLLVMRGSEYWEIHPSVRPLAAAYPEALVAAKAEIARGGNCGEHALVAFDYLRVKARGETINLSDVEGLDHAFVLVGKIESDSDNELAVSDPWPTAAKACLWEDHFAYTPDRKKINARRSVVADGQSIKDVIARGLKLKPEGQALLEKKLSPEQTEEQLRKGTDPSSGHPWIWRHPQATAPGREYEYVSQEGRRR